MMDAPRLLTIKEAVTYSHLSKRTLERMIANGDLEVVRYVGVRRVFILVSDLDRLMKEGRTVPETVPTYRHKLAAVGGKGRRW
jgi:excisionase family DNA binding protein